jgi:hypothetical protein
MTAGGLHGAAEQDKRRQAVGLTGARENLRPDIFGVGRTTFTKAERCASSGVS